jgi:acetyl esterase
MALPWRARSAFALFRLLSAVGLAPTADRTLRMSMEKRLASGPPKGMIGALTEVATRDVMVPTRDGGSIRGRMYEPEGATAPLLYAHGGGFIVGGLPSCDHICRRLAVEANTVVLSVEYRLAPQHRYPGPLDDFEDGLGWLRAQGLDNDRLVLCGDSAGGNLAAALALRLRDAGTPPAGQLLIYPALDLTVSSPGVLSFRGVGLKSKDLQECADLYLGEGDPKDPYASPLLAADLSGSAPAMVVTAVHDVLHDEGCEFVTRLLEAGATATLVDLADHAHGSLSLPALYRGVDELYRRMAGFIRDTQRQP